MNENFFEPKNNSKWILGIFYYNKEDKRIFPPKKLGFGWTVNFANPKSIIAMIVLIFAILLFVKFISK